MTPGGRLWHARGGGPELSNSNRVHPWTISPIRASTPDTGERMAASAAPVASGSTKEAKPKRRRGPGRPIKKGQKLNPTGINGWTKAREKVRDALAKDADKLIEVAVTLAKSGDDKALRLLLGPLLPATKVEVDANVSHSFTDLARKAGARTTQVVEGVTLIPEKTTTSGARRSKKGK